ncbi:MAG: C_GCAxxG_C_C family protein [Lachnospiraceae bacterium]|nr:C_GCAxxG_C_C family protein [Candidatus Colinaster equi]
MNRIDRAMKIFEEGYNCAQSVVLAYEDVLPLDHEMLSKMSCSFGGGLGRMREVCGCVSGMAMVLGLVEGYDGIGEGDIKAKHYEKVQEVAHAFEKENGSIVCRDLLGLSIKSDSPIPEKRTEEYYKKRPCKELVGMAVKILEEYFDRNGVCLG